MERGQIISTKHSKGTRANRQTALIYWNRFAFDGKIARNAYLFYEGKIAKNGYLNFNGEITRNR